VGKNDGLSLEPLMPNICWIAFGVRLIVVTVYIGIYLRVISLMNELSLVRR
jgi:hypothetical protein